jgi:DNA-binding NtrC family response regulator
MQQMDGLRLIKKIRTEFPSTRVIMVTGYSSVEHAVEAMQSGAINYIEKPPDPKKLLQIIEKSLSTVNTRHVSKKRNLELQKLFHFHQMVGLSKPIQEVYRKIQEVAPTDVPVLILGESGTGKELVAKAIHDYSSRKHFPFIPVNTGGIPKELIASELFGHLKGSFTGAISDKKGKFEEAHKGSLFLDEVGTMGIPVQISLLRVLESHEIERIGSGKPINIDVRIICASNEDLLNLIKEHKFREDLYYRLNVVAIELPPLRKRKQDISYLLKYYRLLFNDDLSKQIEGFTKETLEVIKNYSWPGNVRELRNVVLRAMLSASTVIEMKHLPQNIIGNTVGSEIISFKAGTTLSEVEEKMIIETLRAVKGNKLRASEILGISRRSLYNKLEEYKIDEKKL